MTEDEFARAVLNASGPDLHVGPLRQAITEFIDEGRLKRLDLSDCLVRAGELDQRIRTAEAQRAIESTLSLPVTPASQVTARDRLRAIQGWVEELRREFFGQTDPPFGLMEDAEQWLHDESDSAVATQEGEFRVLSYSDRIDTIGSIVVAALDGTEILPPGSVTKIGAGIFVDHGTKGYRLAVATEEMVKASGFTQASLVRLILAGEVPTLPPPRAIIRSRPSSDALHHTLVGRLWPRRISIEMEECDLDYELLRRIYRALRKRLGTLKAKTVSPKDEVLDGIVNELGGLPSRKYSGRFWSEVARCWRDRGHGRENARTLWTRYLRFRDRILAARDLLVRAM